MSRPPLHGWIGVDLDATLAHYGGWRGGQHIGEPIEPMIARVRAWIAEGREVRVFTARASDPEQIPPVRAWLDGLGLSAVGITNVKDFAMVELWDDRCVQVKPNTGITYGPSRIDGDVHVDTTVPDETIANLRAQVEHFRDLLCTDGTLEDAVVHLGSILMDAGIGLPACDRAPTCQSLHLGHRIHALADERDNARAALAAARADGARGMLDKVREILTFGAAEADRSKAAWQEVDGVYAHHQGRGAAYRGTLTRLDALDPATVGSGS